MTRTLRLPLALSLLAGCGSAAASTTSLRASREPAKPPVFLEDDYARALAQAKAEQKPLFIDAWAPWCHTCLSMRAYVFTDPALAPLAHEFVWLAVDTEKPEGAKFVERYPTDVWPTLWVVDAKTETPVLKWLGSATTPELVSLLDDAKAAAMHGDTSGEAGALLLRGNQATATGDRAEAVRDYRASLAAAPPGWAKRPRVVEALVERLEEQKDWDGCTELATSEAPRLAPGTSLANVTLFGLECASRAPAGSAARAKETALATAAEKLATDKSLPILADDRSGLYQELVDHYRAAGRATDARVLAFKWSEFLDGEAKRAPNPAARAVFDSHRLLAYTAIGAPERALPMLAESERDFPADYNPPARIAAVYFEMKRYDEALAAVDRALGRGYGPRKLNVYSRKADILAGKGDGAALAATLKEAVAYGKSIPLPGRYADLEASLQKRLAEAGK